MIVLDASTVIAVLASSDRHHDRAVAVMDANAAEGFIMHPVTLAETLVGGARIGRHNQLHRQIQNMGVEIFAPDHDEPLLIAETRNSTGLKLPDCCVLCVALQLCIPLITFDGQLARVARSQAITVIDPGPNEQPSRTLEP